MIAPVRRAADALAQDFYYAWRALVRTPGTTIVSIFILAVAIAASTTGFSVLNTALVRPLPYPEADRLLALSVRRPDGLELWSAMPLRAVEIVRRGARGFDAVGAYSESAVMLETDDESVPLYGTAVDSMILRLLGARAVRGRLLSPDEIVSQAPAALISDSLWRGRFGADPDIIGRTMRLDGRIVSIVGVLQSGFRFDLQSDIWWPLDETADTLPALRARQYGVAARLRQGTTETQVHDELAALGRRLAADDTEFERWQLIAQDGLVRRNQNGLDVIAFLLFGVTVSTLLVACLNLANLQLVRAAQRQQEMTVRAALGASPLRLFRLSLAENALIGAAAFALGVWVSLWGVGTVMKLLPLGTMPSWVQFGIDWRVLVFGAGITVLAVLGCALAPARLGARADLADVLKAGGGMVSEIPVIRAARRAVVLELGLSLALFVGAVLCVRSYAFLLDTHPGYDADQVLDVHASLQARHPTIVAQTRYYRSLGSRLELDSRVVALSLRGTFVRFLDSLEATPGSAAPDSAVARRRLDGIYLARNPTRRADLGVWPRMRTYVVSESYFGVLGMSLLRGRAFGPGDGPGAPRVAVVSARLAGHLWEGEDPISKEFRLGYGGVSVTVVGVASDVREAISSPAGASFEPLPALYLTDRQASMRASLLVRTRTDPASLWPGVEAMAREIDPLVQLWPMRTLAHDLSSAQLLVRFVGGFVGAFAVCTLLLALVGIYGVIAFGVTQRTREIGVRLALGGRPGQVVGLLVSEVMRFVGAGLLLGLVLGILVTRGLRLALYGTSSADPVAFAGTALLFLVVGAIACWLPARRAAKLEPVDALRSH